MYKWFVFYPYRESETHFSSDTDFEDIEGKNQKQGKGKVRSVYGDSEILVLLKHEELSTCFGAELFYSYFLIILFF